MEKYTIDMDFEIRNININDYTNYKKVFLQLENTIDFSETKFKNILNKIKEQNSYILVVTHNDIIIGTCKILIEYKFGNNKAYIDDLIVDNNHKNKKIGTMLLKKCIDIARENNCYIIRLVSNVDVINFYLKNDFEQSSKFTMEYKKL